MKTIKRIFESKRVLMQLTGLITAVAVVLGVDEDQAAILAGLILSASSWLVASFTVRDPGQALGRGQAPDGALE